MTFYVKGVITECQIQNWFSKFRSSNSSLKDALRTERFKRIDGMQSAQKYSKINTWPQDISIHNLLLLEKDREK